MPDTHAVTDVDDTRHCKASTRVKEPRRIHVWQALSGIGQWLLSTCMATQLWCEVGGPASSGTAALQHARSCLAHVCLMC
jgi:hypothetical protein